MVKLRSASMCCYGYIARGLKLLEKVPIIKFKHAGGKVEFNSFHYYNAKMSTREASAKVTGPAEFDLKFKREGNDKFTVSDAKF